MSLGTSKVIVDGVIIDMPATRAAAKSLGVKRYFTGNPCPKGHITYRYTAGGGCAECVSLRAKELYAGGWRQDTSNRKQINARWNVSNKGMAAKQRWREKNPKRAWCVHIINGMKRRATQKGVPFDITPVQLLDITPDRCPIFGTEFSFINNGVMTAESPSVDRLNPKQGYVVGNVVVISMKANNIKSAYAADDVAKVADWMRGMGL